MSDNTVEKTPETKTPKTPAEREASRKSLLTLLLIILVGVGILYLGLSVGWTAVLLFLAILGKGAAGV